MKPSKPLAKVWDERLHSEGVFSRRPSSTRCSSSFSSASPSRCRCSRFHTWLPDAHVEAPTPISMILAGVLLKFGGYGIIRIAYPICPWAAEQLAFWVALLGIINIVYGAFAAMAQTDFKKLVAYSSISHMGYVILGIAVWSTGDGSKLLGLGHERRCVPDDRSRHHVGRHVSSWSASSTIVLTTAISTISAVYMSRCRCTAASAPCCFSPRWVLPGMCGFVGEFMVVLSAWNFAPGGHWEVGVTFAVLSALTVVLTAAYILWTIPARLHGAEPGVQELQGHGPARVRRRRAAGRLAVLFGVAPFLIFNWMEPTVTGLVDALASFK